MSSLRSKIALATITFVVLIAASGLALRWCANQAFEDFGKRDEYQVVQDAPRIDLSAPSGSPGVGLSVDGRRVRKIEERGLGGFIDWHYAYRIECEPEVMNALVSVFRMVPRTDPELRRAFREVFPEAVDCLERGVAVSASPEFSHIGRGGPDGDHFAALYDEKTSRLYLWAHFNF